MRAIPVLPLAVAVALAAAAAVVAAPAWSATLPLPFPPEPLPAAELGLEWSARAVPPDVARHAAVRQLLRVLGAVLALAGAVAVGAFALLMAERALGRRREMTVRAALGAHGARLHGPLLRDAAPALIGALVLGAAVGAGALALMGATWPGARPEGLPGTAAAMGIVAAVGILLLTALPLTLLPARWARGALAPRLATGDRATADRYEGGGRRLLVGALLTATLALLSGGLGVARSGTASGPRGGTAPPADDLLILPLEAVRGDGADSAWAALVAAADDLAGVRAGSIASAGAWAGLGTRDFALADCGACIRGGLPLRFFGTVVHHHAVSPGFFDSAGLAIEDGRDFGRGDGSDAPPVALVSRAFALSHFQNGSPVGRIVRLGRSPDRWYRVIGVVEDDPGPALGRGSLPPAVVYLSALQHPPDRFDLAVRGLGPEAAPALARAATAAGFRPTGPARTGAAVRAARLDPLRWWGAVVAAAAAAALLLALHAVHRMAWLEGEARRSEIALRCALGARPRAILVAALARIVRICALASLLAIPGAVGVGAALRQLAAGVPVFDPRLYAGLVLLLGAAAAAGTLGPARAASRVPPAEALGGR